MRITLSKRNAHTGRRGSTLVETMIALSISAAVLGYIAFLTMFVAKSERILTPQMNGQMGAAHASQTIADILRNAVGSSIEIESSGRIVFTAFGPTSEDTSAIEFSNGTVRYYPDEDDTGDFWELGRNIESVSFTAAESGQMVEVAVRFVYRKYRGFDQSRDEQLNGIFTSRIYPRNS